MAEKFLLDTSALMALLENELGAERVEQLLEAARHGELELFATFATRMELLYLVEQEKGTVDLAKLKALMPFWPVVWLHSDDAFCDSAAALKASHRVSFADAFVAAAALRVDAILVHKDPEFAPLAGLIRQELLPPKRSNSATSATSCWKGWWGDNPPYHVPTFILTHHAHPPIQMEGGTTFYFVTGGIHEALDRARDAANGMDVRIGGGPNTIQQYLRMGLIDELHLAISPVLLGGGERLFEGIDVRALGYECVQFVASEKATHVVLRRQGHNDASSGRRSGRR